MNAIVVGAGLPAPTLVLRCRPDTFCKTSPAPLHPTSSTLEKTAGSGPPIQGTSMSLAIVHSRAQVGVEAPAVTVEVHMANGLPSLTLVGLPETAVKESKDRVRSAILNSALQYPARRITLNLAPADLPKDGGRFDLAIALGILAASVQVPALMLDDVECLGELALSGEVRAVKGVLPAALAARKAGRTVIVPRANAEEACLASGLKVIAVDHLLQVVAHLNGHVPIEPYRSDGLLYVNKPYPDLREVQGQLAAKRALLIAAAGAHNLFFKGSIGPIFPKTIVVAYGHSFSPGLG